MHTYPDSYESARAHFRAYQPILRDRWAGCLLASHALPYGEDLTIDWLLAEPTVRKERLLILSTGLHGIEAYLGAVILDQFVTELLPGLDPQTTGILLIHTINPWGMKYRQRYNPANVDLNRNFMDDFSQAAQINPNYATLSPFFNPPRPVGPILWERAKFLLQMPVTMLRYGIQGIREAALMGQYRQPQGIYHGGQAVQPETQALMKLYRAAFPGYAQVVHIDLHSGYGPRDQMTLVTASCERRTSTDLAAKYGYPRFAAINPQEFYSVNGAMVDWEHSLLAQINPQARIFAPTVEFGTYGSSVLAQARSLRISILKNQATQFGAPPTAQAWIDQEYSELFMPAEPAWLEKARADARLALNNILSTEGYLAAAFTR